MARRAGRFVLRGRGAGRRLGRGNGNGNGNGKVPASPPPATTTPSSSSSSSATSARGFLAGTSFRPSHVVRLPPRSTVRQFLPYVVPVTTTSVGRVSLFLSMTHVVSSCMGVVGMAAQTVVLGIFDALCPLSQSLSLAAQAFVPGALEEHRRRGTAEAHRGKGGTAAAAAGGIGSGSGSGSGVLPQLSRQFLRAGAIFGLCNMLLVGAVPLVSRFFTTDAAVVAAVNSVAPYLAGIFAMHGLVMSSEGVLLGREDVNFLGIMYGAFFFVMPAFMLRVKHLALHAGRPATLQSIWGIFLGYQLARMALWCGRSALGGGGGGNRRGRS